MSNFNPPRRLLLGTVGWERADWLAGYYPDDLPPDWRLAYYGNDCDCVFIPGHVWRAADSDLLREQFAQRPPGLRCFVDLGAAQAHECAWLELLDPEHDVLLGDAIDAHDGRFARWRADGSDTWRDPRSGACLVLWQALEDDLRAWRRRAEQLDADTRALIIDGNGVGPGRVGELRTLLELLGRA